MHSRKPSTAVGDHIEIIAYLRRKPGLSRSEFYSHWQNVHAKKVARWAEKHGVISYKQIHTAGTVIPNSVGASTGDDPISTDDLIQPVKFDGIALWEVTSLAAFEEGFKDDVYVNDIGPDEKNFLDVDGLGGGVVARFQGKVWSVVKNGKNVVKKVGEEEMSVWDRLSARRDLVNMQDDAVF